MKSFVTIGCLFSLLALDVIAQTTNRPATRGTSYTPVSTNRPGSLTVPDVSTSTNPPIADNISVPDARYPYPILDPVTHVLIWPTDFWTKNAGVLADAGQFGVSSFMGRSGTVSLSLSDVQTAIGSNPFTFTGPVTFLGGVTVSNGTSASTFSNITATGSITAVDYYGDGSHLTGVATSGGVMLSDLAAATNTANLSANGVALLSDVTTAKNLAIAAAGTDITAASNALSARIGGPFPQPVTATNFVMVPAQPAYNTTTTLDFSQSGSLWIPLTGDITFTSANLAAGRGITVRLDAGAFDRTIICPAWHFISGAQSISLSASKTGLLSVVAYDGTDANCIATWASE